VAHKQNEIIFVSDVKRY